MDSEAAKLGVAIVPNSEMIEAIVALQKQIIAHYPLSPKLGTKSHLPHLTLLQGRFESFINWNYLLTDLRNFCIQQDHTLELKLTGLEYKSPGWYFLTLAHNPVFSVAHRFVFKRLKDLMIVTESDRQKDISHYTPLEQFNYLNYGYRYISDTFHPHITLGRTSDHKPIPDLLSSQFPLLNSQFSNSIAQFTLYKQGENGSHAETLYSLKI